MIGDPETGFIAEPGEVHLINEYQGYLTIGKDVIAMYSNGFEVRLIRFSAD